MRTVILLTYRHLITSFDKSFLIWQIVWPVIFIFLAGYSYSGLMDNKGIQLENSIVSYPAFLTAGMIAYNVMMSCSLSGSIIWSDKRTGMFKQLMLMPFTRTQYIFSNILVIIFFGLISASLILIVGIPTIINNIKINTYGVLLIFYGIITGSILFGSLIIILSTRIKSMETFNSILTATLILLAFSSSSFYPIDKVPFILSILFAINPLTFLSDIVRAGLFSQISFYTGLEALFLAILATISFTFAIVLMKKIKI